MDLVAQRRGNEDRADVFQRVRRDPERDQEADHLADLPFLVYLKVTERLVTYLRDSEIRETTLGTTLPDTAARLKVTWQVLPLTGSLRR